MARIAQSVTVNGHKYVLADEPATATPASGEVNTFVRDVIQAKGALKAVCPVTTCPKHEHRFSPTGLAWHMTNIHKA